MRVTRVAYRAAISFQPYETKTLEVEVSLNEEEQANPEGALKALRDMCHEELVKAQAEAEAAKGGVLNVDAPTPPKKSPGRPKKGPGRPKKEVAASTPAKVKSPEQITAEAPTEAEEGPKLQEAVPEEQLTESSTPDDPQALAEAKSKFMKNFISGTAEMGHSAKLEVLKELWGVDDMAQVLTLPLAKIEYGIAGLPKVIKRMAKREK